MDEDTDTLLALLSSLVITRPPPDSAALLDALVQSDGNVHAAARLIESKRKASVWMEGKKRKRAPADLDDWLKSPSSSKLKSPRKEHVSVLDGVSSTTLPPAPQRIHPSSKPAVDLMSVLRQPPPVPQSVPRLPPLTLSNPSLVAQHTPCTLHFSILPPELACRLFYAMIDASRGWQRNKWWLFDKVVESPHRTSFYIRREKSGERHELLEQTAQYWYNGRKTDRAPDFPAVMEEACVFVEQIVNEEMRKRQRFSLEWGGTEPGEPIWRANVAASNCYEGAKEAVGFHSDQLTYLGPYPTIASLTLGTQRIFRLREVVPVHEASTRHAQTFNLPLPHNSLTIMHASCQEKFKHSIPPQPTIDLYRPAFPRTPNEPIEPSNCRINITFRFYRPDFEPSNTPRCKCGVPTILRADMKNRQDGKTDKYWWTCYAGAQNDGKGCNFWKIMDMKAEGRGPIVGSL